MPRILVLAVLVLAVLAGCGGDDPDGGGVPETRPDDFAATFEHVDGSLPPPHHVEWTLTIEPGGRAQLEFVPDYASDGVPRFRESFELDAAALDALYAKLRDGGLLDGGLGEGDPADAPAGGASDFATIRFGGRTIEIPAYDSDNSPPLGAMTEDVRALVPQEVWDEMDRKHAAYARKQGLEAPAPGASRDALFKRKRKRRPGCNRFCRQAGGFGAPPEQRNPVRIPRQSVRVAGDSVVAIRARCRLRRACRGAIILQGRVEYGRSNLRIAARTTRRVRVAVTRSGRRDLRQRGADRQAFATVPLKSDDPVSVSRRLTVLPPR